MKYYIKPTIVLAFSISSIFSAAAQDKAPNTARILDLQRTIETAIFNDPWLVGNKHAQDAVDSMSVAAGSLPDPKVSIDMANLPTNSFDFGQEAMTQFKVGLSQAFPPGDSRRIKRQQLQYKGAAFPFLRQDRRAKITVTVGQLWLNIYLARESIALIEKNRVLFEQLADVAESSYSTAKGKSRQQNVIRAQLEITRLEDRLTMLRQKQDMFQEKLSEWLNGSFINQYPNHQNTDRRTQTSHYTFTKTLPEITLLKPQLYTLSSETGTQSLFEHLSNHPSMRVIEQKIRESDAGINLAEQKYKPEWGIRAGYGYRGNDPLGNNRSDLFSVGITFNVPLFTRNRQDREVQSAQSTMSAVKTEKWQLARKLIASFETAKTQLLRLNQRQKLYESQLLPQIHEQAEASLTAYTNDDGDFAEAVRARIAEIDAEIDALTINVERQKTILQLNYFFITNVNETVAGNHRLGDIQ